MALDLAVLARWDDGRGSVFCQPVAQRCIEAMPPAAELVADKGYDSKALRALSARDRQLEPVYMER